MQITDNKFEFWRVESEVAPAIGMPRPRIIGLRQTFSAACLAQYSTRILVHEIWNYSIFRPVKYCFPDTPWRLMHILLWAEVTIIYDNILTN